MYKVVLADDIEEYLDWLRLILEGSHDFKVVGTAGTGEEALDLVERERPDLVITDVEMPDLNGLYVARRIRSQWPEVKVILISSYTERTYEKLAIEEGALAFIPKTGFSLEALQHALKKENQQ